MLKKVFMLFAVFILAVQFSTASADVPSPERFRNPIIPFEISVESIDAENNLVTLRAERVFDFVKNYTYKVYQSSTYKILSEGEGIKFGDEDFSLIEFNYADLQTENPPALLVTFRISLSDEGYRYSQRRRRVIGNGTYKITFQRNGNEIYADSYVLH